MQRSLIAGVALACLPRIALSQASSCSTTAESPNLLQNPSYEDSDPNSGWNVYGMRSWELTLGMAGSLDGAQHLVIPGVTEKAVNPGDASMVIGPQYYQNVRVEPGHNYYMSFSFRPQVLDRSMEGAKSCLVLLGLDANIPESEALARTTLRFNAQQADLPWQSLSAIFQVPRGGNTQNAFRMLIACDEPDDNYEIWVDNAVFRRLGAAEPCNTLPAETTFAPTTNGGQWQTFSPPRPSAESSSVTTRSTESTPTSSSAVPSSTPTPPSMTETAAQTAVAQVTVTAPAVTITTYNTVTITVTAAATTVTAYSSITATSTVTTTVATETITQTPQANSNKLRKRRGCKPRSASPTVVDTYTTATTMATNSGATATDFSSSSSSTLASSEPTAMTTTVFVTPTSTIAGGTVTETETTTPTSTTTLQTTVATATVTSSATLTQTTTVVQPPPSETT